MMVGLHAALTREQGLGSLVRQRSGRLLSAALLAVLVQVTIAAAPAAADPIGTTIGTVTINQIPARQCGDNPVDGVPGAYYCVGSKPIIKITTSTFPGPAEDRFKVANVEGSDANDSLSEVSANLGDSQITDPRGTTGQGAFLCHLAPQDNRRLDCFAEISVHPKDYALFSYQHDTPARITSLNVVFNGGVFTPCSGPYGPGPGGAGDVARAADACTPPSHTRITQAKITGNTAFFRFTARHATSFRCMLVRNRQVMFNRSCQSPKPYANRLPRGSYTFIATGVNRGGFDRNPATKKFTVT